MGELKIIRPEPKENFPADAKLVFKGVVFDVYQWQQRQFDGSYTTFEALRRPDTVFALPITLCKKIIVIKQTQPGDKAFIGCPGGRVGTGEDVVAAAKRELYEETGYAGNHWRLINAKQVTGKIDWVIYHLIVDNCKQIGQPANDPGENTEVMEVTFEEFCDLSSLPNFRNHELTNIILKAKLHPEGMQQLKSQILGI
jgi:ADP-ribose pyrophosphatase